MITTTHEVSVNGQRKQVPAFRLDDVVVITTGTFPRVAEIFDECWLEADSLPDPLHVLEQLRAGRRKPDLFTFAQRVPDTQPRFDFPIVWHNSAVIPISSYDAWFRDQIPRSTRKAIRSSEKRGVVVRAVPFDDAYVRGIMSIYNESPIRHGRKYWHYGKDFATVHAENGTYRDRSTFLGAYFQGELIGYAKIVWDTRTAAIMQIVSKMEFFETRPNNALLSEAVRLSSEKGVNYLLYGPLVYGNDAGSSLIRFKQSNGCVRMDLPRYYVPLTRKGKICLSLGLHRDPKALVPQWLRRRLVDIRAKWYARQTGGDQDPSQADARGPA